VKAGEIVVVGGLERMGEGIPLMGKPRSGNPAAAGQAGPSTR
jgi:hypothetical protein